MAAYDDNRSHINKSESGTHNDDWMTRGGASYRSGDTPKVILFPQEKKSVSQAGFFTRFHGHGRGAILNSMECVCGRNKKL